MDLSIIIVNWNSKDYLRKCIASILADTRSIEFEIIVIDSASFDGCGEMLRELYPQVHFIQSDKNLGFAGANNAAFAASTGGCVLFLNPDTELVGPAINILHERLRSLPDAGAVGCKLLNSDRTVQTSCIQSIPTILNQLLDSEFLRARWPCSPLWGMAPLFATDTKPQEVETISGACVMLKRDVFEGVGLFSQDYFMYAEDIDLSYKVRKAGRKNYYVHAATVVHHGGSSVQQAASNFSVVMMREAIWRFLRKTRGGFYGQAYRAAMFACALVRLLMLGPVSAWRMIRRRSDTDETSSQKWRAVLRWSLNREGWIKQYYPSSDPLVACPRPKAKSEGAASWGVSAIPESRVGTMNRVESPSPVLPPPPSLRRTGRTPSPPMGEREEVPGHGS